MFTEDDAAADSRLLLHGELSCSPAEFVRGELKLVTVNAFLTTVFVLVAVSTAGRPKQDAATQGNAQPASVTVWPQVRPRTSGEAVEMEDTGRAWCQVFNRGAKWIGATIAFGAVVWKPKSWRGLGHRLRLGATAPVAPAHSRARSQRCPRCYSRKKSSAVEMNEVEHAFVVVVANARNGAGNFQTVSDVCENALAVMWRIGVGAPGRRLSSTQSRSGASAGPTEQILTPAQQGSTRLDVLRIPRRISAD